MCTAPKRLMPTTSGPTTSHGTSRHPVIDVNYVLSITFVVGQTTRKSSSQSLYVPFTPLLRLRHVQEIPSHSKLKAHP